MYFALQMKILPLCVYIDLTFTITRAIVAAAATTTTVCVCVCVRRGKCIDLRDVLM